MTIEPGPAVWATDRSIRSPGRFEWAPLRSDWLARVIVALDLAPTEALELARRLQGEASWVKVGLTLFNAAGPEIIRQLKALGYQVFLDGKFLDIPHQVAGAVASAVASGADMLTVHGLGGVAMLEAAAAGIRQASMASGQKPPAILAVTVLSSFDEASLRSTGVLRPLSEQVLALTESALDSGLAGVVASPQELGLLRQRFGGQPLIVTPGIRPANYSAHSTADDQARTADPQTAFAGGADYIVVGRPITAAADPLAAFRALLDNNQGVDHE
ncbi:MAG: orotidine-5'-phosphate decarboxylase [Actinomycetia bacterium]|nr:orotidine-5'-phosphate decarboxylase [Actinomycetes bacterium]